MKRIEIVLLVILCIIVVISIMSCASTRYKKDCRGVRHERQSGGFYLYQKSVGGAWDYVKG